MSATLERSEGTATKRNGIAERPLKRSGKEEAGNEASSGQRTNPEETELFLGSQSQTYQSPDRYIQFYNLFVLCGYLLGNVVLQCFFVLNGMVLLLL